MIPHYDVLAEDDTTGAADPLLQAYGGALTLGGTAPSVITNFVSTVDGVVDFSDVADATPAAVSLAAPSDRFVMALLRALCDCVLIGAGTLRRSQGHQWTAAGVAPAHAEALAQLRAQRTGKTTPAPFVVVSARGDIPADHVAMREPATETLIVTTAGGAERVSHLGLPVRVVVAGDGDRVPAGDLIATVRRETSAQVILSEAGPHLCAQMTAAGLIDELFLTVAPQLSGRSDEAQRPGLIEGMAFAPEQTPRLRLRSVRRSDDHLFLRYAVVR